MTNPIRTRLLGALLASPICALTPISVSAADGELSCLADFQVAVRQGPTTGLSLKGELYFTVGASGELKGDFTPERGQSIPVTGHARGQLIGLTFDLGNDQYIWGTGAGQLPVLSLDCGGFIGGTFAGPAEGDIGDWKGKGKPGKGLIE